MAGPELNKKKLAQNTIVLYFRMIIIMLFSLYTSRVVLATLGVEDYGIYNVVGGFVTMFSLISGSMATTISRFLTYELGKGDKEKLNIVFCTSINIQLLLSVLIIVLAELLGVWFLNTQMNIPDERIYAANWVFQLSLLSFCVNLINVPYNSVIIAHEKMTAYAYFSIIEAILKLSVVYLLIMTTWDKLIFYSILLLIVTFIMRFSYGYYCLRHFKESEYRLIIDKGILKEMGGFAGWNYLGAGAYIMRTQGLNLLLNLFFGVTVNAARGIASQVESVVSQFISNFTMALTPQIIKSYAQEDKNYMHQLVCAGSKFSFFMMLMAVVPLIYEAPILLRIWLTTVPEYTVLFLRLTLLVILFDTLSDSLSKAMLASNNIKKFQIYVSGLVIMVFPISLLLYMLDFPVFSCYIVCMVAMIGKLFIELPLLQNMIGLPVNLFIKRVILKIIPVSILAFAIPFPIYVYMDDSIFRLIIIGVVSILGVVLVSYFFGMSKREKAFVINKFIKKTEQ